MTAIIITEMGDDVDKAELSTWILWDLRPYSRVEKYTVIPYSRTTIQYTV